MLAWMLKGSLLLAVVAALIGWLRHGPAAARRSLLAAGIVGALLLPCVPAFVPLWSGGAAARPTPGTEEVGVTAPTAWASLTTPVTVAARTAGPGGALEFADTEGEATALASCFFWLWAAGALVLLARLVGDHRRVARLRVRAERRPVPRSWQRALEGVDAEVRFSAEIETPMVVGVLRPTLLLPDGAATWTEARAVACATHECAHLEGHDTRLLLAADLLRALRWPDPLAWWAARRLRAECENTADDAVLAAGTPRADYAELLLTLASARLPRFTPAVGAGGAGAAQRIARVLASRTAPGGRFTARWTAAAGALLAAAIGCAGPGEALDAPTTPGDPRDPGGPSGPSGSRLGDTMEGPRLLEPLVGQDEMIQAKVEEALLMFAADSAPVATSVVVVEVETGRVLALAGQGAKGDTTPQQAVEPASTMKPFAVAAALEAGLDRRQVFDTGGGRLELEGQVFQDAHPGDALDMEEILVRSSNAGAARLVESMGPSVLRDTLARFHLAPADAADWTLLRAALATSGAGLRATPVQIALAYATLANDGVDPVTGDRVVTAATAAAVREMLEAAVERGTGNGALVEALRIGGKTGTNDVVGPDGEALTRATFVGLFPVDAPRWVVHVQVDSRAPGATGGSVAAPLFGRLAAALVHGC